MFNQPIKVLAEFVEATIQSTIQDSKDKNKLIFLLRCMYYYFLYKKINNDSYQSVKISPRR